MILTLAALVAATGFFSLSREESGRWSFVDPNGRPAFIRSCNTVNRFGPWCATGKCHPYRQAIDKIFPTEESWAAYSANCLVRWGFNCVGGNSTTSVWHRAGLCHELILHLGREFAELENGRYSLAKGFPDVFSPKFERWVEREAVARCSHLRDDADLIGYELDNELPWNGLAALSPGDPDYARRVAERYFSVYATAIRNVDSNHLLLGCRFAGMNGAPREVYEVCGKYCDVVSFNSYPLARIDCNSVAVNTGEGVQDAQDAFAKASSWAGGRPIFITEWSFEALDSGLPNTKGSGTRYFTQSERARAAELYAKCMMASPHVVGYSFFKWTDQPAHGHAEDINCGLFTIDARPYGLLTDMFARLHADAGLWRCSPPPKAVLPPKPALFTAQDYLKQNPPVAGTLHFQRSGKAFSVRNDAGLRLDGTIGRCVTNALFSLSWNGREISRIDLMLCHRMAETGKLDWLLADSVRGVAWREADGVGVLQMTVAGCERDLGYEATCDIFVYPGCGRVLLNVAAIRNIGKKTIEGDRVFVRTLPLFVPKARKTPTLLYRPLPDWRWTFSDGRSLSIHIPVCTLVKNEFSANGQASRRAESAFRPLCDFRILPDATIDLCGSVWMSFNAGETR